MSKSAESTAKRRITVSVPVEHLGQLEDGVEAYNLAHPREPVSVHDLIRDAVAMYVQTHTKPRN